jgi:hypothetical protein
MGVDLHVHIGPYIECTYKTAKKEVNAYGCTNTECRKYKDRTENAAVAHRGKFCQECGCPIGVTKMEVPDRPNFHEVVGEDVLTDLDDGTSNKTFFLAPNQVRPGEPKSLAIKVDEGTHNDLSGIDIKAEIAWLEKMYAAELVQLRAAYDNVLVKWGVHSYFY